MASAAIKRAPPHVLERSTAEHGLVTCAREVERVEGRVHLAREAAAFLDDALRYAEREERRARQVLQKLKVNMQRHLAEMAKE